MPTWLWVLLVAATIYAGAVVALLMSGRGVAARELALLVPNLLLLFKDLLRDPRVPRGPKVVLAIGIVWLASPIDLLPEFLPLIGPLDDAVVAALVLRHLVHRAGVDIVREHWRGEATTLEAILRAARIRDA
ncbi:MAG TPA: DUF1232 domain-containing protein [Actinomycetota bacterium]|nr:DUF1232 domain-containing protein [Actinomycetota bacterium]